MGYREFRTGFRLLLLPLFCLFSLPRAGAEMHGEVRTRLDHEGTLTSRAILLYGPTRWFYLARSSVTLREEEDAPAGYQSSRVRLRSPLEDREVSLGVEAGPLILGPIEGRGLYHRLRDPTAGGAGWSALTDRSRFVPILDPEIQDRRGLAFTLGREPGPAGLAAWYFERDAHVRVEGLDGWFSPLPGGQLGRFGVLLARIQPAEERFGDPGDDPWFYLLPPRAPLERRLQAVYWEFRRPERFRSDPRVLVEGWRQRSSLRPPLFAGNAFASLGPPALRGTVRFAAADRGFLTLQEGRTTHSRLVATELSHRSVYSRLILNGTGRWSRAWRWSEEEPGPYRDEGEIMIAGDRLRLSRLPLLQRVFLKGRLRKAEEESSLLRDVRTEAGVTLLLEPVRVSFSGAAEREGYRSAAASLVVLAPAGRLARGRSLLVELSGRCRWFRGEELESWHVSAALGVPLGAGWRVSLRSRLENDLAWLASFALEYAW